MDFSSFETEFLLKLKKRDSSCLKLIENNQKIIEEYLGNDENPKTLDRFVTALGEIIINTKNKGFLKNNFTLMENALNHPYFRNVKDRLENSNVLIKAIQKENKDAMNWLSQRMKINPFVQDENGMTSLMHAAQKNYQFIIKPHLKDLVLLNTVDKYGNNVLFYSVACPNFIADEAVSNNTYPKELLSSGIDLNHTNHDGETALIYCIKNKCFTPISYLIKTSSLDVNIADNSGKTAAMYLTEMGKHFELLSLHRKDCCYDYIDIRNNQSVLSILFDKIYGSHEDRGSVNYKNYIKILSVLVSYQVDFNIPIDNDENTAFMAMLTLRDIESASLCAKHLRKLDLSVKNIFGENATSLCMKLGLTEILELIKNNITFNYNYRDLTNQNTLLIYSVINNGIFMNELLENDPQIINEVNSKNENALIVAAKINQTKSADILMKKGINMNQQDILGNTALHYAIENENPYLVYLLMTKNPDTRLKNNMGHSAMELAHKIGNKEILRVLETPNGQPPMNKIVDLKTKYSDDIKNYITPLSNNNYPNFRATNEFMKAKKEVYNRFVGVDVVRIYF